MHISHNIAPGLAALIVEEAAFTYRHNGTTVPARATTRDEQPWLMLDDCLPLSVTAILVALRVSSPLQSIIYRPRELTCKENGVWMTRTLNENALLAKFSSELNAQLGVVQRICAKVGCGSTIQMTPTLCGGNDDDDDEQCKAASVRLTTACAKLASYLQTIPVCSTVNVDELEAMCRYASMKRERSVVAAAVEAMTTALQNGQVDNALASLDRELGERGKYVAAVMTAVAASAYLTGTISLPMGSSKEFYDHPDDATREAVRCVVTTINERHRYALIAPCYKQLAVSAMEQHQHVAVLRSANAPDDECGPETAETINKRIRISGAYAAISTYFQTAILPKAFELLAPALAMGNVTTSSVTSRSENAVNQTRKHLQAEKSPLATIIRKTGKKRRYLLGGWNQALKTLSHDGWSSLCKLARHEHIAWSSIFDGIMCTLHKRGASNFLCMKHTHAVLDYETLPSTTTVYDDLGEAYGPGVLRTHACPHELRAQSPHSAVVPHAPQALRSTHGLSTTCSAAVHGTTPCW